LISDEGTLKDDNRAPWHGTNGHSRIVQQLILYVVYCISFLERYIGHNHNTMRDGREKQIDCAVNNREAPLIDGGIFGQERRNAHYTLVTQPARSSWPQPKRSRWNCQQKSEPAHSKALTHHLRQLLVQDPT
jgi:hypothetical protein